MSPRLMKANSARWLALPPDHATAPISSASRPSGISISLSMTPHGFEVLIAGTVPDGDGDLESDAEAVIVGGGVRDFQSLTWISTGYTRCTRCSASPVAA